MLISNMNVNTNVNTISDINITSDINIYLQDAIQSVNKRLHH